MDRVRLGWARNAAAPSARVCSEVVRGQSARPCVVLARDVAGNVSASQATPSTGHQGHGRWRIALVAGNGPFPVEAVIRRRMVEDPVPVTGWGSSPPLRPLKGLKPATSTYPGWKLPTRGSDVWGAVIDLPRPRWAACWRTLTTARVRSHRRGPGRPSAGRSSTDADEAPSRRRKPGRRRSRTSPPSCGPTGSPGRSRIHRCPDRHADRRLQSRSPRRGVLPCRSLVWPKRLRGSLGEEHRLLDAAIDEWAGPSAESGTKLRGTAQGARQHDLCRNPNAHLVLLGHANRAGHS